MERLSIQSGLGYSAGEGVLGEVSSVDMHVGLNGRLFAFGRATHCQVGKWESSKGEDPGIDSRPTKRHRFVAVNRGALAKNLTAIIVLLIIDGLLTAMPACSQDTPEGIPVPDSLPFGRDVCVTGDVDGDGVPDLCASQPTAGAESASGVVVAVSGKSGKALWATMGGLSNEHFGMSIG